MNTLTGNTICENEILPTREENIGMYAVPRCMFGWFGFLIEGNKLSYYYFNALQDYKQITTVTHPSQGFEILVSASFRSHYSGVLITFWHCYEEMLH